MKNRQSVVLLGLLIVGTGAFAQSIPTPAKTKLAALYPSATNVKWGKEDGDYEASFKNKGQAMSLVIDAKGMVKETETVIAPAELPATVLDYMAKQMPGKKIKEAAIIMNAAGTKSYEAEVNGKDYLFDTNGKLLK